jgi:hypothetical protein
MKIELELFRIFADKDISYVIGQEDNEFHDSYGGFFSKDDPEETMIESMILHRGSDQLLEIIYKSGKNRWLNLRLIESYHYKECSK